jgi:hypothetical protein
MPEKDTLHFILQNSESFLAYDIFTNNEEDLYKYARHNISIVYRLQPFPKEEVEKFKEKSKVFFALATRDFKSACDPVILHLDKAITVSEMKKIIFEKIKKITKLKNFDLTISKLKFYTYSLLDYKPQKDILLLKSKDDDPLFNYCKHNILIEIPSDVQNNANSLNLT